MFTHLHNHSHFSLLDGLPKIDSLVMNAKKKGFAALALTDHGTMYGAIEFYKKCKAEGIKPIIGMEAYVAPQGRLVKEGRMSDRPYHLILLSKNFVGYKNLMRLSSVAHIEGFYYKPRIDWEILKKYKEGLIILSGCVSSELSKTVLSDKKEIALQIASQYKKEFGEDYYIEIQRQPIIEDQEFERKRKNLNSGLVEISKKLSIPLVATADCHYLEPHDADAQDLMVCIETGKTVQDTDRLDMRGTDLSLKTEAEMNDLFSDLPEALENTGKVADKVNIEIPLRNWAFPHFPIPKDVTYEDYLHKKTEEGLIKAYRKSRFELEADHPEVLERLEYELNVICKKGYAPYFLIVADAINWARSQGIVTTTRGSAAGSLVSYALGIITINPLKYDLPFERFLNMERPLPPDIDMDFADNRREEVIDYVSQKYGRDKVAQIVTFGTMQARAAIRDVGRALAVPYSKCDKIAKLIPFGKQGFQMTIEKALKIAPELKTIYDQDPETKKIIDLAKKLEGAARHASIHAAGVVISPTPLTDFTPLRMDTETKIITTQYDMYSVEETGLVKMDFLGIRNLSILGNAIQLVKKIKRIEIDLTNIPLNDKKTFEMLAEGQTIGLFQLGGSGMTKYLKDLKPSRVEDIMAMVALYRPGPMESIPEFIRRKHDPKLISYLDPRLKDILSASYGVLTYQEDVLLIAIKIAGYTWAEADKLRKAMGKKIPAQIAQQKEKFIDGCMSNGLSSVKTLKLWSLIEPFAAYGFGKAHAASYGIVAYQTAYMKANYPVEYMAALMTAESANLETIAEAVTECRHMGISVLPPDVNESFNSFTVIDEHNIRFGLGAVKNLGSDVITKIITERRNGGKFSDLSDFVTRTFTKNFNKKSWEALTKSGALDAYGDRNVLLANTEKVLNLIRSHHKELSTSQNSLFGASQNNGIKIILEEAEPASQKEKLTWEKELLGLYVTAHPLDEFKNTLEKLGNPLSKIKQDLRERRVRFGGIITKIKTIITKKGDQMAFAEIEDFSGSVELVVFPSVFSEYRMILEPDKIVKVSGKVSDKDGEVKILADKFEPLDLPLLERGGIEGGTDSPSPTWEKVSRRKVGTDEATNPANEGVSVAKRILLPIPDNADPMIFRKLKTIFEKFPGDVRVDLDVPSPHGPQKPIVTEFRIDPSDEFKVEVKKILSR